MMVSTLCTFLTPLASKWDMTGLIQTQVGKAIGHTVIMPAFSVMLGKWIPRKKLVSFMAYTTCGIPTGAFFMFIASGVISGNYKWSTLFYVSGTMGVIWCLLWIYLCFNLHFIPILTTNKSTQNLNFPERQETIPFRKILLSTPFWGYIAAGIASYWILVYNIMLLPLYLRRVFKLEIGWNGLISSFPNVLQAFVYLLTFTMSEHSLAMNFGKKTSVRRIFMCIGLSMFASCMVLLTFVRCHQAIGILLMVLGIGASGFSFSVLTLIPVDMSPKFSGILSGMMNTIGSIAACTLPTMVGYFTKDKGDIDDWIKVFYASTFVTFICMIIFMAYSSCEIQPWNNPNEPSTLDSLANLEQSRSRRTYSEVLKESLSKHTEFGSTGNLTNPPHQKT